MQISWIEVSTTLEQGQSLFVKQGSPFEAKEAPVWNIMSVLLFLFKLFSFILKTFRASGPSDRRRSRSTETWDKKFEGKNAEFFPNPRFNYQ